MHTSYPQRGDGGGAKGAGLAGGQGALIPPWPKPSLQLFRDKGETSPNKQPLGGLEYGSALLTSRLRQQLASQRMPTSSESLQLCWKLGAFL